MATQSKKTTSKGTAKKATIKVKSKGTSKKSAVPKKVCCIPSGVGMGVR